MSFGGGLSAWLFREIVEKRKWLTATEFLSGLTLVQALPGVNMTNMSVYVGQRLRGVPGVLSALFGLLVGPFFILIALSSAYHTIDDISWSHAALAGLATSAVGLLLSMGVKAIRAFKPSLAHGLVLLVVVATVGGFRLPMVPVIVVMAPISVAIAWFELRKKAIRKEADDASA
jgi:chromate transporter